MTTKLSHDPLKYSNQAVLEHVVKSIFQGESILCDVRKETQIRSPDTGSPLELDVWIPRIKLCFEFQDHYHYTTSWYSQLPLDYIREQDSYKKKRAEETGNTLIVVPCWWDGNKDSLIATIRRQRSDLLPTVQMEAEPIPDEPPPGFFYNNSVPGVGELMLASFTSQSTQFDDPECAWWMGEKYDGIRCCWNAAQSTLYSRNGFRIRIPEQISRLLPKHFLDAEIWFGRGNFSDAVKVKLAQERAVVEWPSLRIVSFDNPNPTSRGTEFEQRYRSMLLEINSEHPFLTNASRVLVISNQQLTSSSHLIISDGGEGVILRKIKSFYEGGRSNSLLKLKATRADQEALVVDIIGNEEQEQLMLKLADGTLFTVRTPRLDEMNPLPNIGDIVMFSYENYSKSLVPIEPKIQRVRTDLSWNEVLENASKDANSSPSDVIPKRKVAQHPSGYWSIDKHANMRLFFEKFAKDRNFDPLVPENWYSLSAFEVYKSKGAATIMNYFKGSYATALTSIFPDIGLITSQFASLPRNFWGEVKNRREALEDYARSQGFDPLIADHWYNISSVAMRAATETHGYTVLNYYGGSFVKAVMHLFPDIGLDIDLFTFTPTHHWADKGNQRDYLDILARQCGFDPLVADNWYSFKLSVFFGSKRGRTIASYYGGNAIKAIKSLYPELPFDDSKFPSFSPNHWKNTSNRRKFFLEYAQEHNFDPLVPENWYSRKLSIEKERRVSSIVRYYRGSLTRTLLHVLPDIGLEKFKFPVMPLNHWKNNNNVRDFFIQLAKEKGFDPFIAGNWYRFPFSRSIKRANSVLRYFGFSYTRALTTAFPDISFDLSAFPKKTSFYWEDKENRKKLFCSIAKRMGFDPFDFSSWTSQASHKIFAFKGAKSVLKYYNDDLSKAHKDMFSA